MGVSNMSACRLIIKDHVDFKNYQEALVHISKTLIAEGIVKESHRGALLEREEFFPTGIALDGYAVAIPHCEAQHANSPAIYIIKTDTPVLFNRADENKMVSISLIIALVVISPAEQLTLLKTLFNHLQNHSFYQQVISSSPDEIKKLFEQKIITQA